MFAFARTTSTLFAVLGATSLFALGCGGTASTSTAEDSASIRAALESDNGGMQATPEAPAFADSTLEATAAFDTSFADSADMTTEAAAAPGAHLYHLALVWGHLPAPDGVTVAAPSAVDWTGSVSVSAGAIGVKRTLQFDKGDHLDPRTAPSSVSFTSHTLPFVDGLFLHVVVPAGGAQTLHFDTAALKADIDLAALGAKEGGIVRLADGRNGLAFIGYPDSPGCARGLLLGRWTKVADKIGRLRAHVVDGDGAVIGHARGIWGHAPRRDKDVFFGKYIGVNGEHRGLFGGTYGGGEFHGLWGTVDPKNFGALEGFYSDGYEKDDGHGAFLGRWSERCDAK